MDLSNDMIKQRFLFFTECIFLVLLGIYIASLTFTNTTFEHSLPGWFVFSIRILLSLVVVLRVVLQIRNKLVWIGIIVYIIYNLSWDSDVVPIIAIMTLGCIGISYIKVIKSFIISMGGVLAVTVLVALGDGIENILYLRNGHIRSSLGIFYPTDLAAFVFFLILASWIVFKKTNEIFWIPTVMISIWISSYITQSRTSMICSFLLLIVILYLIFEKHIIDHYSILRWVRSLIDICLQVTFPFCSLLVFFLTWSYSRGHKFGLYANKLMSTRLKVALKAFQDHDVSAFGAYFEQQGLGNTTYSLQQEYTFMDISYVNILLTYGMIILLLISILWVLMTRKAIKNGDRRLAFALALAAFDAVTEHHFLQIDYNIFLLLPFADFTLAKTKTKDEKYPVRLYAGLLIGLVVLAFSKQILSYLRIILYRYNQQPQMIIISIMLIAIFSSLIYGVSSIVKSFLIQEPIKHWDMITSICAGIAICFFVFVGNSIVISYLKDDQILDTESPIIESLIASKSGEIYVDRLGEIYKRRFKDIRLFVLDGEDLARYDNTTVILDNKKDSRIFRDKGFLYSGISPEHGLYTNDPAVINELKENGYNVKSYCNTVYHAELNELADDNELLTDEDGCIILNNDSRKLVIGSDYMHKESKKEKEINLYAGQYTLNYKLKIDESPFDTDFEVCRVNISAYNGEKGIRNLKIYRSWFDDKGDLDAAIKFESSSYPDMGFTLTVNNGLEVRVEDVFWTRNPDYDVHSEYENGMRVKDTFYDENGNLAITDEGYSYIRYGYKDNRTLDEISYYDENDLPVITASGYACKHRKFDDKGQCVQEEYLDTEGNLINTIDGYAVRKWDYDSQGNAIELSFFNTDERLTMTAYGYAKVKREFDKQQRIIQELYYGDDNNVLIRDDGFSGIHKYYNSDDAVQASKIVYVDKDKKPVKTKYSYSVVQITYNVDNTIATEEYYDKEGNHQILSGGFSKREILYDPAGDVWLNVFYDANGGEVLIDSSKGIDAVPIVGYYEQRDLFREDTDPKNKFGYIPR